MANQEKLVYLDQRPESEVIEYYWLAWQFVTGLKKWKRIKGAEDKGTVLFKSPTDGEEFWRIVNKRLLFYTHRGQLVPAYKNTILTDSRYPPQTKLYKGIDPENAEDFMQELHIKLLRKACEQGFALGIDFEMEHQPGDGKYIQDIVHSPQYKLTCEIGWNLHKDMMKKYNENKGRLKQVKLVTKINYEDGWYGSTGKTDETGKEGAVGDSCAIKPILVNDIAIAYEREELRTPPERDLDIRDQKLSPQERKMTKPSNKKLLNGALDLTAEDLQDGADLASAYRTDMMTSDFTDAYIFEYMKDKPLYDKNGKTTNSYHLHCLNFLLQSWGCEPELFPLLCDWFNKAKKGIYFPTIPKISEFQTKRLVDYVTWHPTNHSREPLVRIESLELVKNWKAGPDKDRQFRYRERIMQAISHKSFENQPIGMTCPPSMYHL